MSSNQARMHALLGPEELSINPSLRIVFWILYHNLRHIATLYTNFLFLIVKAHKYEHVSKKIYPFDTKNFKKSI